MCPVPEPFDTILGRFEPTGQCSRCGRVGWNMTGGLCSEHFRNEIVSPKQRETLDLWDIHDLIVFRETLAERPRPLSPTVAPPTARGPAARPTTTKVDEEW